MGTVLASQSPNVGATTQSQNGQGCTIGSMARYHARKIWSSNSIVVNLYVFVITWTANRKDMTSSRKVISHDQHLHTPLERIKSYFHRKECTSKTAGRNGGLEGVHRGS